MPPEEAGSSCRAAVAAVLQGLATDRAFFQEGSIGIESLEPSKLKYHEVQRGVYDSTIAAEGIPRSTDQSLRDNAYQESLPNLQEGAKATLAAAAIEGGTAFVLAVVAKRREGKQLQRFQPAGLARHRRRDRLQLRQGRSPRP